MSNIKGVYTMNIDDFKSWEDISKCIRHEYHNMVQNEFIIFNKIDSQYILLSNDEIKKLKSNMKYNCYLLPWYCFDELSFHENNYYSNGFNAYPKYDILKELYRYRNNQDTYKLLWFTNVIYHIIKNGMYDDFEDCLNYNDGIILEDMFYHLLEICSNEVYNRLGFDHKCIYGQTRKNFSPVETILYKYEYINKCLDISNVNVLIDYISLLIQQVKSDYRFIVVYHEIDEQLANILNRL